MAKEKLSQEGSGATATKNFSVSLPKHLVAKLNQLDKSGAGGINLSKTIRYILEQFLQEDGLGKLLETNPNDVFCPVDLYLEIMKIGRITLKNRAARDEVKLVSSFGNEYVLLSKDEILNIFVQMQIYQKEVQGLKDKVSELEDVISTYSDFEKRISALEKSKK